MSYLRRLLAGSKEVDTGQAGVFQVGTGLKHRDAHGGPLVPFGSAGGGGWLQNSDAFDIVSTTPIPWTQIYDNTEDANPLAAFPDSLGLEWPISSDLSLLRTLVAGAWAFSLTVNMPDDATATGHIGVNESDQATWFGPWLLDQARGNTPLTLSSILVLPADTLFVFEIASAGATSSPWVAGGGANLFLARVG